jgi:hypothetical protein
MYKCRYKINTKLKCNNIPQELHSEHRLKNRFERRRWRMDDNIERDIKEIKRRFMEWLENVVCGFG